MNMKRARFCRLGKGGLWGLSLMFSLPIQAADNLKLHGTLVAEPCVILPADADIQLDFGTVIDKYLYLNGRTHGQQFELRLSDCDLSLGNTVRMTFSGTENPKLPGLLALDSGSMASGVGIGIETDEGVPVLLSHETKKYPILAGNNVITLKAYVKAEQAAIATKSIGRGSFSASATFNLEYE
ncbi:TPA: fimbrial protein [Serratia liquefaciens]|nr:fimbrial protein [Serratia liquefaciens]HEJ7991723.1 fimbrial protein [Serratia liquefaciens]